MHNADAAESPRPAHEAPLREDIQGLRALAVVLVILSHLPAPLTLAGGFVGVDIFFVISGFVITRVLMRSSDVTSRPAAILGFMRRRMTRLMPAMLVVIGVTALLRRSSAFVRPQVAAVVDLVAGQQDAARAAGAARERQLS
jgi:peptidoglycan/LPS O-acetylase OafA/YrhL